MTKPLPIGTTITDRDGYCGTITNITHFDGSHWYDVRFDRGSAVRYDSDIASVDVTGKAMELAIEAKSGGGTSADDVADLVAAYCPELDDPWGNDAETDAKFDALVEEVLTLIPFAPFNEGKAMEWARAGAEARACERAENFTPFGA